jgi:DNA-binding MarR family transcriptional regulator
MLTATGEALRDTLLGYAASVLDRALTGVSAEEIAMVRATLQRIKENL